MVEARKRSSADVGKKYRRNPLLTEACSKVVAKSSVRLTLMGKVGSGHAEADSTSLSDVEPASAVQSDIIEDSRCVCFIKKADGVWPIASVSPSPFLIGWPRLTIMKLS